MEVIKSNKYKPGSHGLLSLLSPWISDNQVSEILINKPGEVWVEISGIMHQFQLAEITPLYLKRLFTFIANENKKVIAEVCPILSGNIYYDMRVQLVIPPAAKNYTLSIRKQSTYKHSLSDLNKQGFYEKAEHFSLLNDGSIHLDTEKGLIALYEKKTWMAFLEKAILLKKNIIISGATSSGKTSLLNACLASIPNQERIITLEDTFELSVPQANKVSLLAQKDKVNYSMQDLLRCVLRLRPDRILMGEIRGPEVLDFIASCQTGHNGAMATIHAHNPKGVITRMTQLYKQNNIPSMTDDEIKQEIRDVIDIIVQLERDCGKRYISAIYYKEAT